MDYSTLTIEELITLKDEKEAAFEIAKDELNEVADALREKLINQELENKLSQMSPEEIEILRNMANQMSVQSKIGRAHV